jgi:hypothetical protein
MEEYARRRGRPRIIEVDTASLREMLAAKMSRQYMAEKLGISVRQLYRIIMDPDNAEAIQKLDTID